jgi:hypothetical protein
MGTEKLNKCVRSQTFSRIISIIILLLHFYHSCYTIFLNWGWHTELTDKILGTSIVPVCFRRYGIQRFLHYYSLQYHY